MLPQCGKNNNTCMLLDFTHPASKSSRDATTNRQTTQRPFKLNTQYMEGVREKKTKRQTNTKREPSEANERH